MSIFRVVIVFCFGNFKMDLTRLCHWGYWRFIKLTCTPAKKLSVLGNIRAGKEIKCMEISYFQSLTFESHEYHECLEFRKDPLQIK